jgi:NAD(P)-dependent dehydrogenase (short-subunit alcohol dehydrogenase family)
MNKLFRLFVAAIIVFAAPHTIAADDTKSILVTGASTGIGRHLTETLAENGYHVYAGARKDEDLADLDAMDNVTAVRLDVTKQEQVDAAVELIKKKGTGLYALVNNAGVGGGGPVVETPIEDQTFVHKVNVEGVYRTTKAFAPAASLRRARSPARARQYPASAPTAAASTGSRRSRIPSPPRWNRSASWSASSSPATTSRTSGAAASSAGWKK